MELKKWSLIGVIVVFFLAAFWHFIYNLLPNNFIGAISPVNESPWEHAKLFFIPAILYYVIMFFIVGKEYPNFVFAHSIALLIMPIFMLIFYYLYSSFIKETFIFDMINSFSTVVLGSFIGYKLTKANANLDTPAYYIGTMLIVTLMLFTYSYFTFRPPSLDMFRVR